MFLRALLIALIVYIPEQLHFPRDLGLKGVNVFNLLLIFALIAMMTVPKIKGGTELE